MYLSAETRPRPRQAIKINLFSRIVNVFKLSHFSQCTVSLPLEKMMFLGGRKRVHWEQMG